VGFPNMERLINAVAERSCRLLARKEKNTLTAPPPRLFKMVGKNVSAGVIPSWWGGRVIDQAKKLMLSMPGGSFDRPN